MLYDDNLTSSRRVSSLGWARLISRRGLRPNWHCCRLLWRTPQLAIALASRTAAVLRRRKRAISRASQLGGLNTNITSCNGRLDLPHQSLSLFTNFFCVLTEENV